MAMNSSFKSNKMNMSQMDRLNRLTEKLNQVSHNHLQSFLFLFHIN